MHLDAALGALIQTLDDTVGRDRYVLALTSDHGVATIPEDQRAGRIAADDLQALVEQVLVSRWGARAAGRYVAAVNSGNVFFGAGVFDRLRAAPADLEAVERALLGVPGIARVLQPDRLSPSSSDPIARAAALSYVPGRSGDLVVVPRRSWMTVIRSDNYATTHGTMHDYDREVPILLLGGTIAAGRHTTRATPADIAPTLAQLAHVVLPTADGRVLREAVRR